MRSVKTSGASRWLVRAAASGSVLSLCAAAALSRVDNEGGGGGGPCYKENGTASCCKDYSIDCSTADAKWTCPQDSNNSGYTVALVTTGSPGKTQKLQVKAGSCTIKRTVCGSTPNACDDSTPVNRTCYNEYPNGAPC